MDDSNIRTDIIPDDDENRKGGPEMECSIYQNYTADEVFVQGLAGIVNQQDVESMIVDRDMNGHRGAKIHSCK